MERAKQTSKSIYELAQCYAETQKALKATARETAKTKKLWREGNKSNLIKIGMACIMFPDPSPVGEIRCRLFGCRGRPERHSKTNSLR